MRFLSLVGALAIVIAVAAAVFFFGGFYNVAATQEDNVVVAWVLEHVREASIAHNATEKPPIALDDKAVQAGARAYAVRGCVNCHGRPGADGAAADWAKFSEGLQPSPPDLKEAAPELKAEQIFWIVKNGVNMTGMPAFEKIAADDKEIWSIAAFVKKLPDISEADYTAWTAAPADAAPAAK